MRTLFDRLRSVVIWLVALPFVLVACAVIWLGSFVLRGRAFEALIKGGCRTLLVICGVRLRVAGRENFVPGRQYVVMMNHVSFLDPFVFYAAFPGVARGAEEESHFRWPVYGGVIRRMGMFRIDRKNTERAVESLRQAAAWIRERPGFSFGIMPEGTRTPDGKLGPFKRGGFLMALETGLDILPLVQRGAYEISRKGSLLIRPGRLDVTIEPAVPVAGSTRETVNELVARVRGVFLTRLGESPDGVKPTFCCKS
jgi:1-acyl-sn-glycerol-3-phosphate acyltransferase